MALAHSPSFCATLSFVQIHYSKLSYTLTGAHDVEMQVGPQQMPTLFFFLGLDLHLLFAMRIFLVGNEGRIDFLPISCWMLIDGHSLGAVFGMG